ncbi:MAG: hypothetical protein ACHREM_12960 [Polyangiales bacterium]
MSNDEPGAGAHDPHSRPQPSTKLEDEPMLPRQRVWPALLVTFAIVGAGSAFAYKLATAPKPLRVLVSVDFEGYWWQGSEPAAALSDKLAERLSALGFDVVRAGDPEVMKILEKTKTAKEAAQKLRAAYVIEATLAPEDVKHDVHEGYHELRLDTPIYVRHMGDAPIEAGRLRGFTGSAKLADARTYLARNMADQAFDAALPALMDTPTMKAVLADHAGPDSATINPAFEYRTQRDKEMQDVREAYEKVRRVRANTERAAIKPTYLSAPDAHDELIATGRGGALVHGADVKPFWFPENRKLGWFTMLETLEWNGAEKAGETAPFFKAYNLYGYATASADGTHVVLVEDLFGWAKTVTVLDDVEGKRKPRRHLVDERIRYVGPHLSRDGRYVAVYAPPCRECNAPLLVISGKDGKTVDEIPHEGGQFTGFTWLDDHRLAFTHTPADAGDLDAPRDKRLLDKGGPAIWVLDVSTNPPALEGMKMGATTEGRNPSASADGTRVALESAVGNAVVVFDVAGKTFASIAVDGPVERPQWSPDGTMIAFGYRPPQATDEEIGLVAAAGGATIRLTDNDDTDRYPMFSADGRRVFYETVDSDPNFPRSRYISWIASVAVPGMPGK